MTATVCSVPGCPELVDDPTTRGRCERHRLTTSQRGYGLPHQLEAAAARPGARCEACGCTRNLQRDHRDPTLVGPAREAPANKRWLCDCPDHRCHSRLGRRSSSVAAGGRAAGGPFYPGGTFLVGERGPEVLA